MQLPVAISLLPSRWLRGLLFVAHVAALLVVLYLPLALTSRVVLGLAVLLSLWVTLRRLQHDAVDRLLLRRDGQLEVFSKVDADGTPCTLAAVTRLGGLLVLGIQTGVSWRYLVLLPDAAASVDMRRLRVWLDWRKSS